MTLEYSKARNQNLTCSCNGLFLHSSYNPEIEAQRFVESLEPSFIPENIIIIEPALGYCKKFLKEKFPTSKIFAIRIIDNLKVVEHFDHEFFYKNELQLENELFNYFLETGLLNSYFISWPASSKCFKTEDNLIWTMLKKLLKNCQSILATRQFFAERWIKNQINFFKNIQHASTINKFDLPIIVCASGPSLKKSILKLKECSKNFFILACSSSIKALLKNGIVPDLCISTDGGFWAKKHLNCLCQNTSIKLAISTEAAIQKKLFSTTKIIPLAYCDNFDNYFFDKFNIPYVKAKRNGTISGTAVELALSLTSKNVFMCGVDLEAAKGFVHTQPNELEIENSIKDNKINNLEKRIFCQSLETPQLKIYRDWFINNSKNFTNKICANKVCANKVCANKVCANKVCRLSDNYKFIHKLDGIPEINFEQLAQITKLSTSENSSKKNIDKNTIIKSHFSDCNKINFSNKIFTSEFLNLINTKQWQETFFPADMIMINRKTSQEEKQIYLDKLKTKIEKIKNHILQ